MQEGFVRGRRIPSGNMGVSPFSDCSTKTFTFVEQSPWNNPGIFAHFSCLPRPCGTPYQRGRDATCCVRKTEDELAGQTRKDTDSELFANNSKWSEEKLCKKVVLSSRKPTPLFRKMGWSIFFFEQPLVIRKIRMPLCSNVRNLFVEQSAHFLLPK